MDSIHVALSAAKYLAMARLRRIVLIMPALTSAGILLKLCRDTQDCFISLMLNYRAVALRTFHSSWVETKKICSGLEVWYSSG